MDDSLKETHRPNECQLSHDDKVEIERLLEIEQSNFIHNMIKLGAGANLIGAFVFMVIMLPTSPGYALLWYAVLMAFNGLNILWAQQCNLEDRSPGNIQRCLRGYLVFIVLISVCWSSIGVLFTSTYNDEYVISTLFLSAVLICFSFSTAMVLKFALASILGLVFLPIVYHLIIFLYDLNTLGEVNRLSASFVGSFTILAGFMSVAVYFGNRVVTKVIRLSYENKFLRQKIENMNVTLEKKVKARTIELEKSLDLVSYQANHDLLTELPNERMLEDRVAKEIEFAMVEKRMFAIVSFSINELGKIGRSIGYPAVSSILKRGSERLHVQFKKLKNYSIYIARHDVFIGLIHSIRNEQEVIEHANAFFGVFEESFYHEEQELNLTISVGISVFPDHGRDVEKLKSNSDAARILAKEYGGNSLKIYDEVINKDAPRLINLENQLYHAIESHEMEIYYQPFIDLKRGTVFGCEALLRWNSKTMGMIPPLDFIPIAEANGMIIPIGEWVLKEACRQLKKWHQKGFDSMFVSVNLSAKQLMHGEFVERVEEILSETQLHPKFLMLEMTESRAFKNEAINIIEQLTQMGVRFSIDDFGTGFSELSTLKLIKIDKIKIDKTFVQDMDIHNDSLNIVGNTIALASNLNIECIAEGVEKGAHVRMLLEHGCYQMQGFYFSKPLPASEFYRFVQHFALDKQSVEDT